MLVLKGLVGLHRTIQLQLKSMFSTIQIIYPDLGLKT